VEDPKDLVLAFGSICPSQMTILYLLNFVDDLHFIKIVYLLNKGVASYNIHVHVPSDIHIHNEIIAKEHLAYQEHLSNINENMVFNRSPNHYVTKL